MSFKHPETRADFSRLSIGEQAKVLSVIENATYSFPKLQPTKGIDWRRLLPRYWIQIGKTDRLWDARLNWLLDNYEIEWVYFGKAHINGVNIWIENWAYGYGDPDPKVGDDDAVLPMVRTRLRLRQAVDAFLAKRKKMWPFSVINGGKTLQ